MKKKKNKAKRLLPLCLCSLLTLGAIGCSNSSPDSAPLSDILQPIFQGGNVVNETVMFLDYGDSKQLLYTPDQIISVTSYDGDTIYKEGIDYKCEDGTLTILPNSSIPCITSKNYYVEESAFLINEPGKGLIPYYWGEADAMAKYQVCVNYTHSDEWDGFKQTSYAERYKDFIEKLEKGEDVTVCFYGDSITHGSNSSFSVGIKPYQYPYPILFLQALAEIYDYTITFPQTENTSKVPEKDLVYGSRGTITYLNGAVGGWYVYHGLENFDTAMKPYIEEYGCDLFVLAFGMNDGGFDAFNEPVVQESILNRVLKVSPEASLMIVSTMVPCPNSSYYKTQEEQEELLLPLAERFYKVDNVPCAVACMTSVSLSVLEHKDFMDISGNNVNHPNDFLGRIYAQTLLQTLLGYENIPELIKSAS